MIGFSHCFLFRVAEVLLSVWIIVAIAFGSARAEDDIEFARCFKDDMHSGDLILHGSFLKGYDFYLLSGDDSSYCRTKSSYTFRYSDLEVFEFSATRLEKDSNCSESARFITAVQLNEPPQYELLSHFDQLGSLEDLQEHDSLKEHLESYKETFQINNDTFTFFIHFSGGCYLIILKNNEFFDLDYLGTGHVTAPYLYLLNGRLYIQSYVYKDETGYEQFRISEVTEEGLRIRYYNHDFSI